MATITELAAPDYPYCGYGALPEGEDLVGCRGRRVYESCLAHLDDMALRAYLASLRPGSDLDHRGTTISAALLERLLSAVRNPDTGRPSLGAARFDGAVFDGGARFGGATFTDRAEFNGVNFRGLAEFTSTFQREAGFARATFHGPAAFGGATFARDAEFDGAAFTDSARFTWVTFKAAATFDGAVFRGDAAFGGATFRSVTDFGGVGFAHDAWFDGAVFHGVTGFAGATFEGIAGFAGAALKGDARFGGTTFADSARFAGAAFTGNASFRGATFSRGAWFDGTVFQGAADFAGAVFERASMVGPLACRGTVDISRAVFAGAVTLEIAASRVECWRTRWTSTAVLRLRHAAVGLSGAVLETPVSVAAHPLPFARRDGAPLDESAIARRPVRILGLLGTDASHLTLRDVDLTTCRVVGTFHLDQLRLHGRCPLATAPTGARRRGVMPLRHTTRQTLVEEHHWRAARGRAGEGWTPAPTGHAPLQPAALAPVYRELRKAFEDSKNEPGAADFYYGEMEMRRHDTDTPPAERFLLWLYWAASGYGLRASRALGWLLAAMTTTVVLMIGFGLPDTPAEAFPPGARVIGKQNPKLHAAFTDRFTAARAQKAADVVVNSVIFRSSGQDLTTTGRYTEMASRLTEPALLALALLAVRGRVKR
ncbi:pentapeptide repeat-containing protein [Streptomyces typhae]|nr:pentapeptide repeat-containing protein [Streptomyces typhae]